MSYLKDFQTQIQHQDYPGLLGLWEEYCASDEIDPKELILILRSIKNSSLGDPFGRHVDKILPLWKKLEPTADSHECIKLIFDLQTINSESLGNLAFEYLKDKYGSQKYFGDKIRFIGLRGKESFQGAISNYELLTHMEKGNFVFHTGGWGVGQIGDVSVIREQLSVEFDYVPGRKDLSFANAFKTLIPIPNDHFLALRFGSPELLEEKARKEPVEVIRMLLRDLGPKTAAEIKDELCELVIPTAEWTRWWQAARAKIKKDTKIETPEDIRETFSLRQTEISHEERFQRQLDHKPDAETLIQMLYAFMRDFSETLKNGDFKGTLCNKVKEALSFGELTAAQSIQIHFFLEDLCGSDSHATTVDLIKKLPSLQETVAAIEILAFKKRLLVEARKERPDWESIFIELLMAVDQSQLRDYILSELIAAPQMAEPLKKKIEGLLHAPYQNPEAFLWYFQKVIDEEKKIPFANQAGKIRFFEAFLVLLSHLQEKAEHRDLIKKMHNLLSEGRYAIVRQIMQHSKLEEVKEFLLLATKCHSLSDHDIKIFHSLAEVVHPSLSKGKKKEAIPVEAQVVWTTAAGHKKLQERIEQIGTVETVANAEEIKTARGHGDLKENAEFKAALEKRDRLQSELKMLSDQLNRSRILTKADISTKEVGVGTIVECTSKKGQKVTYTILGPWDTNPEKNIISYQSKLAQEMNGLSVGKQFQFQGDEYTIASIKSYL